MFGLSTGKLIALGLVVLAILGALGTAFAYVKGLEHRAEVAEQQRDKAYLRAIGNFVSWQQCRFNMLILRQDIDHQNASVRAQAAESARRLTQAQRDLREAERGRAGMERRLAVLSRAPAGATACERVESADRALLETLR